MSSKLAVCILLCIFPAVIGRCRCTTDGYCEMCFPCTRPDSNTTMTLFRRINATRVSTTPEPEKVVTTQNDKNGPPSDWLDCINKLATENMTFILVACFILLILNIIQFVQYRNNKYAQREIRKITNNNVEKKATIDIISKEEMQMI